MTQTKPKRSPGRPRLAPDKRRTERYQFALTASVSRRFERALKSAGYAAAAEWFHEKAGELAAKVSP